MILRRSYEHFNFSYSEASNLNLTAIQEFTVYTYAAVATLLSLPLPGGLGSYFTNFRQEFEGTTEVPYQQWNYPAKCQFFDEEKLEHKTYIEWGNWIYFANVLSSMTNNSNNTILSTDIAPILSSVPDYISLRRYH